MWLYLKELIWFKKDVNFFEYVYLVCLDDLFKIIRVEFFLGINLSRLGLVWII